MSSEPSPVAESLGIVQEHTYTFGPPSEPIILENGRAFGPIDVRYETYGSLNAECTNAILILHAFTGDAHAAGFHTPESKHAGWWNDMIGPGKPFDTNKYFVICSNVLGGCRGTTGPASLDPHTGTPYALSFPVITIRDMVNVQKRLIDHLGIARLLAVAGGSMGGMQALEWSVAYPEMVASSIVLASTARLTAQGIAFNAVGRNAIMSDPHFQSGNYYSYQLPAQGLSIARMVGHITYLSDESMGMKFGRKLQERAAYGFDFADQFQVESYLEYQGDKFVDRFDANSYIYLSKAMDYYDLGERYGGLERAAARIAGKVLVISFTSDWLYPPYQAKEIVFALMKAEKDVSYTELNSPYGHDSFLLETKRQGRLISSFLGSVYEYD
ncbi:MAG: homoserine O-acetyltransferase [Spirochaetia bacterium]